MFDKFVYHCSLRWCLVKEDDSSHNRFPQCSHIRRTTQALSGSVNVKVLGLRFQAKLIFQSNATKQTYFTQHLQAIQQCRKPDKKNEQQKLEYMRNLAETFGHRTIICWGSQFMYNFLQPFADGLHFLSQVFQLYLHPKKN